MIHFVVDSTFCVSKEYAKKNDIKIANLTATLGDKSYNDGKIEEWETFYNDLENGHDFPKTTQPSPEQYEKIFNGIIKNDENAQILVLTISATLSGTFNCATMVAKGYTKNEIEVLDSMQTAQSALLLLEELVILNGEGKTFKEIVESAKILREKTMIQFVPTSLEYLKRGGRIGKIQATIATVLNVKPLLVFKDNVLKCQKKVMGINRAIIEMINNIPKTIKKIYVCYIKDSEFINVVKEKVMALFNLKNVEALAISPVVGSHIGIGAVGVATLEN
jgi:DegV family protein with EDD domain